MISTYSDNAVKVAGYLEKKSKMRVVNRWKKMWFVLDGRLLLYYKSQLEYKSLSPCRGTVNMGLAANVVPGKSNEIIVSTRSHTVSLRALNHEEHEIWLQALIDAMFLPKTNRIHAPSKPVQHFRYSSGDLDKKLTTLDKCQSKSETMPALTNGIVRKASQIVKSKQEIINYNKYLNDIENNNCVDNKLVNRCLRDYKFDKLHKKFSKIAVSDSSIPGRFRVTSDDFEGNLRRSASVENDLMTLTDNIYESVKDSLYSEAREYTLKRDRLKRSDSDCLFLNRLRPTIKSEFRSEERLKPRKHSTRNDEMGDVFKRQKMIEKQQALSRRSFLIRQKEIKSDTDLALRRPSFHSGSCGTLWFNRPCQMETEERHCSLTSSNIGHVGSVKLTSPSVKSPAKRSHSFLRMLGRNCDDKQPKTKKRSMSFLSKIWKKREKKWDDDAVFFQTNPLIGKDLKGFGFDDEFDTYKESESMMYDAPQPEPPPDYDEVNVSSDSEEEEREAGVIGGPDLPPRQRDKSPWHDVPKNNRPVRVESPWDDSWDGWEDVLIPATTWEPTRGPTPWGEETDWDEADDTRRRNVIDDVDRPTAWEEIPIVEKKVPSPNWDKSQSAVSENKVKANWRDKQNGLDKIWQEKTVRKEKLTTWKKQQKKSPKSKTPVLPSKRRDFVLHESDIDWCESATALRLLFQEDTAKPSPQDLDNMLLQLQEINNTPLNSLSSDLVTEGEPDYDIPRPHASLLKTLRRRSNNLDTLPPTHFLATYDDSLDPKISRKSYEELVMAPDSLECDPWSLASDVESQNDSWATYAPIAPRSTIYQDSLNPILKT